MKTAAVTFHSCSSLSPLFELTPLALRAGPAEARPPSPLLLLFLDGAGSASFSVLAAAAVEADWLGGSEPEPTGAAGLVLGKGELGSAAGVAGPVVLLGPVRPMLLTATELAGAGVAGPVAVVGSRAAVLWLNESSSTPRAALAVAAPPPAANAVSAAAAKSLLTSLAAVRREPKGEAACADAMACGPGA